MIVHVDTAIAGTSIAPLDQLLKRSEKLAKSTLPNSDKNLLNLIFKNTYIPRVPKTQNAPVTTNIATLFTYHILKTSPVR